MHARIQIYWCRSSIFRHLKLELLTQFPASNDEKYINVVYIWRKFVSFYGYVHWRMTTEISVMYGSEKVKKTPLTCLNLSGTIWSLWQLANKKIIMSTMSWNTLIFIEQWSLGSTDKKKSRAVIVLIIYWFISCRCNVGHVSACFEDMCQNVYFCRTV